MEFDKKIAIKILHVENPLKFFFRTVNDVNRLNAALKSYVATRTVTNNHIPTIGEVIVVKVSNNLEIARTKSFDVKEKIHVSMIDTEKDTKVNPSDVILLTDQTLAELAINTRLKGAISGILPAKKVSFVSS